MFYTPSWASRSGPLSTYLNVVTESYLIQNYGEMSIISSSFHNFEEQSELPPLSGQRFESIAPETDGQQTIPKTWSKMSMVCFGRFLEENMTNVHPKLMGFSVILLGECRGTEQMHPNVAATTTTTPRTSIQFFVGCNGIHLRVVQK